jgi:tetratricopeptide (TPR) repeat protein
LVASGEVADLSRVLVADEIGRVRNERWSGVLAMSQGEVTKGLYFLEGEIVFAASTVEEDRLGACLFRAGRLTEPQFRAAMREVEASGFPLGYVLVESRVLTPQELADALAAQVERIVLSVLRWTSGTLRRDAMDRPIPADQALDLDTNRLLLAGMRLFPDAERLERALGDPSRRLRRVTPAPFDYEQAGASPAERAALALAARGASLADLLKLPHPRPQMVRAVHALLSGGLIEDAPAARPAPPPAPPPSSRAAPLRAAAPPAAPPPAWASYEEPEPAAASPPRPLSPEELEKQARSFLERGNRERAIEVLRQAVAGHPAARGPRRLLALTLSRETGFKPEVERLFVELLESEPSDTELRYALASYYRKGGFAGRAILQLRLVLSADSGHAAAWRDLGELEAGPTRRR